MEHTKTTVKISVTSKLDGIRSWSLQAIDTCPGSIESPGVLVDACKGCYATTGFYVMDSVKAPRLHNREDWQRLDWCDDMVFELARDEYFRWLDSGDLYSLALAEKVLEIMIRTPWCKHWLPTRMHKFQNFAWYLIKCELCLMYRFDSLRIQSMAHISLACMARQSGRMHRHLSL